MCAKGGQGPARALKQSHNHRTASADGPESSHGPFSCFHSRSKKLAITRTTHAPVSSTEIQVQKPLNTSAKSVKTKSGGKHVSAAATSNRRTTSYRRTQRMEQRAVREIRRTTSLVRFSLSDTHPHDWARIFRRRALTARTSTQSSREESPGVRKRNASKVQ